MGEAHGGRGSSSQGLISPSAATAPPSRSHGLLHHVMLRVQISSSSELPPSFQKPSRPLVEANFSTFQGLLQPCLLRMIQVQPPNCPVTHPGPLLASPRSQMGWGGLSPASPPPCGSSLSPRGALQGSGLPSPQTSRVLALRLPRMASEAGPSDPPLGPYLSPSAAQEQAHAGPRHSCPHPGHCSATNTGSTQASEPSWGRAGKGFKKQESAGD